MQIKFSLKADLLTTLDMLSRIDTLLGRYNFLIWSDKNINIYYLNFFFLCWILWADYKH